MGQVSTVLYRINFKYIIENCVNKELWKKKWVIYEYDNIKIIMQLSEIDVRYDTIKLRVSGPLLWDAMSVELPMKEDHFNETVFYQKLLSAIKAVIEYSEDSEIEKSPLYKSANDMEYTRDETNEKVANDYLDGLGITDKKVRESYIDQYVSENSINLRSDVKTRLRYTIHTARYLMLGYQFEKLCEDKAKALIDEVGSKFENQEVEEYVSQISKALEMIDFQEMTSIGEALKKLEEQDETDND